MPVVPGRTGLDGEHGSCRGLGRWEHGTPEPSKCSPDAEGFVKRCRAVGVTAMLRGGWMHGADVVGCRIW